MHMLSKKDFSSDEMETLRRSRIPTVVTANGEVQTNEEAQVFVHDLDLFVTVQILDDTPVLLLGKLCDEHGCFYKWVSGKQPRLTKQGKKKHILQNGRFRTSCCPWIVEFFYISIAGETKSSTREESVVQDLATQWIQSYPCKRKTNISGDVKEFTKVSRAVRKAKSHLR